MKKTEKICRSHGRISRYLGAGNNPMVGMTDDLTVAVEESLKM